LLQPDVAIQRHREGAIERLRFAHEMQVAVPVEAGEDLRRIDAAVVGLQGCLQARRKGARAVIAAEAVALAAAIREAVVPCIGVEARADLDVENRAVWNALGADIDVAAAERRRHFRRVGFLHFERVDHFGRKDVERNHVAREVRRRHLRAVQLHARVALP
jgi:hypothetical protein